MWREGMKETIFFSLITKPTTTKLWWMMINSF
jgi:hypothetical protein